MGPAADLAERLGLPVHDLGLLEQALVHSSWLHEHRDAARGHNERLEFLGDVVVNLAISEALFEAHPSDDEGLLSTRRASIVSTTGLARLAGRIDLGAMLLLGEGEAQRGGRRRPSLLASAFEAVAGALYLDLGWERTRRWLVNLAEPELSNPSPCLSLKSPKSRLQEHTQRRTGARPEYRIVAASGRPMRSSSATWPRPRAARKRPRWRDRWWPLSSRIATRSMQPSNELPPSIRWSPSHEWTAHCSVAPSVRCYTRRRRPGWRLPSGSSWHGSTVETRCDA